METSNNSPKIPEHYRAEKISGMMPDQVVFAYDHYYTVDINSKEIYVKTDSTITDQVLMPSYFDSERSALMKVLHQDGDEIIEGYIADLRFISSGSISEVELTVTDETSYSDTMYVETLNETHEKLLGAIFLDLDGNELFNGDPRLITHAMHLATELDNYHETQNFQLISEIEDRINGTDSSKEIDYGIPKGSTGLVIYKD